MDFLHMPSSCPDRMLAMPLVLHLTYPVGRAHEDKSHIPGAVVQAPAGSQDGNRPPAQPSDRREDGAEVHTQCGRQPCSLHKEKYNQVRFTRVLASFTDLTFIDL